MASDISRGPTHERELAQLVDRVVDYGIILLDPEGRVLTWNQGARRTNGYEAEEIIGQHFERFYTEPDRARKHPQHELEIAERDGTFEEEGWRVRKDGTRFWATVAITALRDEHGTVHGFGKVTRDLTSRRAEHERIRAAAEELARANEELRQFQILVTSVIDYAIFRLGPDGRVATWNLGAERIKGYRPEEIIGQHFERFYTEPDRARKHPQHELEIAGRDGSFHEEGWRLRKDGSRFWASVAITALRDEHGAPTGFAKVTRDLSERREADESLALAQADLMRSNADLDSFASSAAHDLREPIRTAQGFAELLADRYAEGLPESGQALVERLTRTLGRAQGLVDGLLAFARSGAHALERVPISTEAMVREVLEALGSAVAESRARVEVDLGDVTEVEADPVLLPLVLQNLVANAIKFTHGEAPSVEIRADRTSGVPRFTIRDAGIGIPEERQATIFDSFERLGTVPGKPGSGLGLSICKRIVERHGGAIGVESAPGEGSAFWFTLPAAA